MTAATSDRCRSARMRMTSVPAGYADGAWSSTATAAYPSEFSEFLARLCFSSVREIQAVAGSDRIPADLPSSAEAFAAECLTTGTFDRAAVQVLFELLPKTRPHKITGSAEPGTAFFRRHGASGRGHCATHVLL